MGDEIEENSQTFHLIQKNILELTELEREEKLENLYEEWIYLHPRTIDFVHLKKAITNFGLEVGTMTEGGLEKAYNRKLAEIMCLHLIFMKNELPENKNEQDEFEDREEIRTIKMKFNKILKSVLDAKHAIKNYLFLENTMAEEKFVLTDSDLELYRFVPMDYSDMKPYQKLLIYLLQQLSHHKYKRYQGDCYKQYTTQEGNDSHYWKKAMTIKQFINNVCKKEINPTMWKYLTSAKDNLKAAEQYLVDYIGIEFEELNRDRHVFSFRDGIFIIKNMDEEENYYTEWIPYGTKHIGESVIACKYYDEPFNHSQDDWFKIVCDNCPNFKGIMDYQEWSEEVQKWLCIMIGRNLFDIGELDEWQVMAYLLGQAGTGKSTIITKIVKNLYESCDVGVLSNNIEKKFGLGALEDKIMFVGPEIKGNLSMEQSEFQSIISGEDVQVATKHKTAKSIIWKVPGIFGGNEVPCYTDNSGSISRRLIVFKFDKKVKKGDTRLGKKLLKELKYILQGCSKGYLYAINTYGEKDIWSCVPEYFRKTKESMAENTNALTNFLKSEKIRFGEGLYVREKIFIQRFNEHCISNNLGVNKWCEDYYLGPFQMVDVTVERSAKYRYPNVEGGRKFSGTFFMGLDVVDESEAEFDSQDPEHGLLD